MSQFISPEVIIHNKPAFAVLALATHYVLHSGEWDNDSHIFLGVWTITFSGVAVLKYVSQPDAANLRDPIIIAASAAAVYFGTLITSIILHRGFFHRLKKVYHYPLPTYEDMYQ
jgi:hypothetical protein